MAGADDDKRQKDGSSEKNGRGRNAERPSEIPRSGWRDIALRVKEQISRDNLNIVSAGVAFYSFLALFPALIATIMLYGIVMEPATVEQQLETLTTILPPQARDLLGDQLHSIVSQSPETLGFGVLLSLLLALWSANKGMKALFSGLCIAYDEIDNRGFFKQNSLTLLFTLGGILMVIASALLIVAFPVAVSNLGLPSVIETALRAGRWVLLLLLILISLALVYRYGPDRANPRLRWVSGGSLAAAFLWLLGSWAFSFYVANFGNYNATYGSVAAVVIVLLWFLLTAFIILLGAEINSEMEGQTRRDTTTGEPKPMGERGAYHADHLREQP